MDNLHNVHDGVRRFPCRVRAMIGHRHVLLEGWTRNLSMGGAFIETICVLPRDTRVVLRLDLPDSESPLLVPGDVRWSRTAESSTGGVGIRFERLDEVQTGALSRFLMPPRAGGAGPAHWSRLDEGWCDLDGAPLEYSEYEILAGERRT